MRFFNRSFFVFIFVMVASWMISNLVLADPKPPKNVISMAKARGIALKAVRGKIKGGELEFENKIWIYSFDMLGKDGKIHEVNVDALTGKVVSSTVETPAKEAAEKAEDAKATPATK